MIAIEDAYSDAALVSQAKRKLFLKILFEHCNQNLQSFQTNSQLTKAKPIAWQSLEVAPTTESNTDPPLTLAPAPPPTPPPKTQGVHEKVIATNDLPKLNGILSFGKFLLEIN